MKRREETALSSRRERSLITSGAAERLTPGFAVITDSLIHGLVLGCFEKHFFEIGVARLLREFLSDLADGAIDDFTAAF